MHLHRKYIIQPLPESLLSYYSASRSDAYVRALAELSRRLVLQGINPQQGLRVLNVYCYSQLKHFKKTSCPVALYQLEQFLKNFFCKPMQPRVNSLNSFSPTFRDTHFLFMVAPLATYKQLSGVTDYNVHFIRTQRRYNKRRYARVRAVSRPSFWAGMTISATAIGMFWGASQQLTDWATTQLIITNIYPYILLFYLHGLYSLSKVMANSDRRCVREINKIRRGKRNLFKKMLK